MHPTHTCNAALIVVEVRHGSYLFIKTERVVQLLPEKRRTIR